MKGVFKMIKSLITNWKMGFMRHDDVVKTKFDAKTTKEILDGCKVINAQVPGNFELDFSREGLLPEDLYFGENILKVQELEDMHLWYFSEFEYEDNGKDGFLLFEGIDTAANIYIDGEFVAFTENMLIPYEFPLENLSYGRHEVVVHIIPTNVYVRGIPCDSFTNSSIWHDNDSNLVRKAPYMFGWDIMARTVTAGLWKEVSVVYKNKSRIEEYYYSLNHTREGDYMDIRFKTRLHTDVGNIRRFTLKYEGVCGDSSFEYIKPANVINQTYDLRVLNPKLWWPVNYGEPNLYKCKITLYLDGEECDSVEFMAGLRSVELVRTSCAGKDGKFEFIINGKRIFVMGTNWVPTDSFPSRHAQYNLRGLELAKDIGCNMIRCWGGNVYPDHAFYDYCDKNGILIWQDFSMACGRYPQDERFCRLMRQEAEYLVKALHNHPCLALWSGDNECDSIGNAPYFNGKPFNIPNPNDNIITRNVISEVVRRLDGCRPYLPSSPYIDEEAFKNGNPSENHLWGPRDYFKGDYYYKKSVCHFASETGYHGCPSPESLRKFISEESINDRGDGKICTNREWLTHATCVVPEPTYSFSYRIPLMTRQVERLFGAAPEDIEKYALESQISQAEAMKFFIEHFRIEKWYRTGIIWWNIIDGWAQVSDAIVDWYGTKKLAYGYIKRSQNPFCMMCDEPDENGNIKLCASNDTRGTVNVSYKVTNALTDEVITEGTAQIPSDKTVAVNSFREEKVYYRIEWTGDMQGINHFTGKIGDGVTYEEYTDFMKKMGYYEELEGFKK